MRRDAGFTLIEMVCVLAIVALLASLVLPAIPRQTSTARLNAFGLEAAALLISDRNAAIRRQAEVSTAMDSERRMLRSGSSGAVVQLPADVVLDAIVATQCAGHRAGSTIDFFPSGMSCGGVIGISREGAALQVRVNWLTGGVEVVPVAASTR